MDVTKGRRTFLNDTDRKNISGELYGHAKGTRVVTLQEGKKARKTEWITLIVEAHQPLINRKLVLIRPETKKNVRTPASYIVLPQSREDITNIKTGYELFGLVSKVDEKEEWARCNITSEIDLAEDESYIVTFPGSKNSDTQVLSSSNVFAAPSAEERERLKEEQASLLLKAKTLQDNANREIGFENELENGQFWLGNSWGTMNDVEEVRAQDPFSKK